MKSDIKRSLRFLCVLVITFMLCSVVFGDIRYVSVTDAVTEQGSDSVFLEQGSIILKQTPSSESEAVGSYVTLDGKIIDSNLGKQLFNVNAQITPSNDNYIVQTISSKDSKTTSVYQVLNNKDKPIAFKKTSFKEGISVSENTLGFVEDDVIQTVDISALKAAGALTTSNGQIKIENNIVNSVENNEKVTTIGVDKKDFSYEVESSNGETTIKKGDDVIAIAKSDGTTLYKTTTGEDGASTLKLINKKGTQAEIALSQSVTLDGIDSGKVLSQLSSYENIGLSGSNLEISQKSMVKVNKNSDFSGGFTLSESSSTNQNNVQTFTISDSAGSIKTTYTMYSDGSYSAKFKEEGKNPGGGYALLKNDDGTSEKYYYAKSLNEPSKAKPLTFDNLPDGAISTDKNGATKIKVDDEVKYYSKTDGFFGFGKKTSLQVEIDGKNYFYDGKDLYNSNENTMGKKVASKEKAKLIKSENSVLDGAKKELKEIEDEVKESQEVVTKDMKIEKRKQYGISNNWEIALDAVLSFKEAMAATDSLSVFWMDDSERAQKEAELMQEHSWLKGTDFFTDMVCGDIETQPLAQSGGIAVVTPIGGTATVGASIQGKISGVVETNNETKYLYKITYYIKNSIDEDQGGYAWDYNVELIGTKTKTLWTGKKSVEPGDTEAYTKNNMIAFYSTSKYDKICINFDTLPQGLTTNPVCNTFVEEQVKTTILDLPDYVEDDLKTGDSSSGNSATGGTSGVTLNEGIFG